MFVCLSKPLTAPQGEEGDEGEDEDEGDETRATAARWGVVSEAWRVRRVVTTEG